MSEKNWPLWEVFIRTRNGMAHRHVGSLHAVDAADGLTDALRPGMSVVSRVDTREKKP